LWHYLAAPPLEFSVIEIGHVSLMRDFSRWIYNGQSPSQKGLNLP